MNLINAPQYDSDVKYGGFQGGPQTGLPDVERCQSHGQADRCFTE